MHEYALGNARYSAMREHWAGQRDGVVKPVLPAPWSRSISAGASIAQLPWLRSRPKDRIRPCPLRGRNTKRIAHMCERADL